MGKYRVVDNNGADVFNEDGIPLGDKLPKGKVFDGEDAAGIIRVLDHPKAPNAFVLGSKVRLVDAPPRIPTPLPRDANGKVIATGFITLVTNAAREFGPDRDYLLAAAYFASSNLTDVGKAGSEMVGPFHISAAEWKEAITTGVAKDLGLTEDDRYEWNAQPEVAALLAADQAENLKKELGEYPFFNELYFAQRFGKGAAKVLKGDRGLACSVAIKGDPPEGSFARQLQKGTQTVQAVLDDLKKGLIAGLTEAFTTLDTMDADIRIFRHSNSGAPWMSVALTEQGRNIAERPGEQPNQRILQYHKAAGIITQTDTTPWCASFVTFCMKESGIPEIAASIPTVVDGKGPAWAPRWNTWGDVGFPKPAKAGDRTPVGTVITWQADVNNENTGHIGFLAEEEKFGDTTIKLLGGNQGARVPGKPDELNIKNFPVANIIARRWLNGSWPAASEISAEQFKAVFPDCKTPAEWAAAVSEAWQEFGFTSKLAQAAFLGITGNETGGYVEVRRENTRFTARQAAKAFSFARVPGTEDTPNEVCIAKTASNDPVAIANWAYANRLGNGGESTGDGFKYRGCGIIQLTGRVNFEACAAPDALNLPALVADPELLVNDFKTSARAAAWFIVKRAKILAQLDTKDERDFLTAALKVGLPANETTEPNRLKFRRAALRAFGLIP